MKTSEQIESELHDIVDDLWAGNIDGSTAMSMIKQLVIQPRLTDEQIDAMFLYNMERKAAKQVRDLLQGKGGEGV